MTFPVFYSVPIATFSVTGTTKMSCLVFFAASHQVFVHLDQIYLTLLSSRLNVTNFISFSSHDKSSNLLLSLWLFAGLFPIHPCVLYTGKPQTGHSTP